MTHARRTIDRRRRVLYSTQQADLTSSTAASRRTAEQWREARRPTATYAARVHRRLRGRWFSLVPVKRRTLTSVAAVLWGIAVLLSAAHYASVAWPSIVNHPEIARPLRLDRPDSLGRWVICVLLAGSAGASLLIYQVRRYRVDDYTGQYRLWRLVLIAMFIASINSLVSLVDWAGALLDLAIGERVALSGSDWLSIVITIGGAVLALRLTAEVRRSRWALTTMIVAWTLIAIPVAAKWNIFAVDSIGKWSLVTTAPLLAYTTLFISLGGYLRLLYRQVRNLDENDSLAERFQEWKVRYLTRLRHTDDEGEHSGEAESKSAAATKPAAKPKAAPPSKSQPKPQRARTTEDTESDQDEDSAASESSTSDRGKRRWWSLRRSKKNTANVDDTNDDEGDDLEEPAVADDEANVDPKPCRKRRWLGLRAAKAETSDQDELDEDESEQQDVNSASDPADEDAASDAPPKKRGRFSFGLGRRKKSESDPDDESADSAAAEADDPPTNESDPPAKKRGLGGWLSRGAKKKEQAADDDTDGDHDDLSDNDADADNAADDQDWQDPDSIDWDSLSKTERRKLRKQLKRQGRAA
ncbi:hypothetical protein Rcae01_03751 [Novipirellula caenicola]|uniref:Uncharacterized protein n=2 Tax=Novipirellula caenicola TaxID=1536901 RepID=A0ABP9VUJ0_9BACT